MKARGIRGGILLTLAPDDTQETVEAALDEHRSILTGTVSLEVASRVEVTLLDTIREATEAAGGRLAEVRPPQAREQPRGETVILSRTVRSGAHVESAGSVVILGDVNAGAEILANDDIIVIGTLRGLAHAGAGGNEKALIWAQRIRSPQLRIGAALAQAGGDDGRAHGPEVAQLQNGQIVLRPWGP